MTTVLYHDDTDGFCAAWVASKYLPEDTEYRAVQYGQDPPWEVIDGRNVYVLDFSYKRKPMQEIINRSASLVCLDHHSSAVKELSGLVPRTSVDEILFDVTRAGCRMALDWILDWKILRSKLNVNERLVDYVQDRDLWKFELPNSREINAEIRSFPTTFEAWDELAMIPDVRLIQEGRAILRNEQRQVELILRNTRQVTLGGHRVWAVNTPVLISECAGELATRKVTYTGETSTTDWTLEEFTLFGVAWFQRADGKIQVSLRSRGDFDVSELARKFGGGGHKGAAGFEIEAWASPHSELSSIIGGPRDD